MEASHSPFYDLEAVTLQSKTIKMQEFARTVILIVNTASRCGLTPQLKDLERLYKAYKDKGFVILGFPCNQFARQEPGNECSIATGCVTDYGITFPMFSKVEVNGKNTHPIFQFLKQNLKSSFGPHIKWNFTKFLLDQNGIPVKRFAPTTRPKKIEQYIVSILNAKH